MWQRGQVANQVLNIHIWPDDPNNYQPHPFSLPYQTHPGFRQEGIRLNGSPQHWIYIWDPNNPYFGHNFQEWLERTLQVHAPGPWHANGGEVPVAASGGTYETVADSLRTLTGIDRNEANRLFDGLGWPQQQVDNMLDGYGRVEILYHTTPEHPNVEKHHTIEFRIHLNDALEH